MPIFDRELKDGKLYLKSFLIDTSLNDRGWAVDPATIDQFAHTFMGKPFTIMLNKEESLYKDFHPFYPSENNPVEKDIEYSEKYAVGHIVDVVPTEPTRLAAYSGGDPNFKSYDAIIEIEDPVVKEELQKPDTRLIPPEVSPGIIWFSGDEKHVGQFIGVHLAAVPAGAYGPRAKHIATCMGDTVGCKAELLRASSSETDRPIEKVAGSVRYLESITPDYKSRTGGCPLSALSSLVSNNMNLNSVMSFNQPSSFTSGVPKAPTPIHVGRSTISGPTGNVLGTQEQTGNRNFQTQVPSQQAPNKITLKIKSPKRFQNSNKVVNEKEQGSEQTINTNQNQATQQLEKPQQTAEQPQIEQTPQEGKVDSKFTKELEELRAQTAANTRRWELSFEIPKEVFVDKNGKFLKKEWEKAIEDAIAKNIPSDYVKEYYALKVQAMKFPSLDEKETKKSAGSSIGGLVQEDSSQDTQELNNTVRLLKLFGGHI